jgi:hexosaminidase|eukprot:COSAG06_NODE_6160_length_3077_cov_8.170584_2_plen_119_part_00
MIDTGRRYYPVALVKQTIEGMAMSRQNILHFHLSEECFRVQSDVYPQLTASCVVGSHNNTAFYTKADISDIVSFARERGVRVLPEFDMPGHSGGFCTSLASAGLKCCGGQIEVRKQLF